MQAAVPNPIARQDALASIRRTFLSAKLAVGVIAVAFIVMASIQATRSSWMQHGRHVARLGREILLLASAEQSTLRGALARREDPSRSTSRASTIRLMLDSLVGLTADNPAQHENARASRTAIDEWQRLAVSPLRASRAGVSPASTALRLEAARFDTAAARLRVFLLEEERLYRRRVSQERLAFRVTIAVMLTGLVTLLLGLRRMHVRMREQTLRIIEQTEVTERQNLELALQREQLSEHNEELRHQTEQLQEQAVELEDQAATLQEHEAELEATVEELRDNEERFRVVVNSMSDMVYTVDRDQRFLELFGNWIEGLGVDRSSIFGRTPGDVLGPELGPVHDAAHAHALLGQSHVYDWTMEMAGSTRHFTTAVSPLRDVHGQVAGAVGVMRDMSEQRRREERHRAVEEQLRHTQRLDAVGQLAGGVAHDFNNLLTVVLSYCDILRMDRPPDSPESPMLAQIRHAAIQGSKLTSQLLAVGRRQVMRLELLDLNVLVQRTEQMLRRVIDTSIGLHLRIAPERTIVHADAAQVEQILLNLVINGRDAMPQGGTLTIATARVVLDSGEAREAGVEPGVYAQLEVADTGSGMSDEVRSRIFEPFFTTKPVGKGTGLGLATVHGIVRQSGGHIMVSSEVGRGTELRVLLPWAVATAEELARLPELEAVVRRDRADRGLTTVTPASVPATSPTVPGTVLLVDDDHAVRDVATQLLSRDGHTVIGVASAIDALHVLEKREHQIDLVVSDVVMPHMSGRELAYEVRIRFPEAGIVLMSGYSKDRVLREDALSTDTIFLDKPFTRDEFLVAVHTALGTARRRAAIATSAQASQGALTERPVAVIMNSVDAVVWEVDARTGRFHYVNRRAETLLGYPLARWLESGFFESIVDDLDRANVVAFRNDAIRTGLGGSAEYRIRRASGSLLWLRDQIQPVLGEDGRVMQLRGVTFDITEKKLAEEELARERAFLAALLDNLSDGIVACDHQAVLTLFNGASRELHGSPLAPVGPDEWAERYGLYRPDGVTPMPPEEIPLYRALRGEPVNNAEIVVVRATGEQRSLLASGRRFHDEQGEVKGAVVALRDVTEIKRAERELVRAKEVAERASRAKSHFLSLVSHELRTPLNAVIGFAGVLQKNRRGVLEAGELSYLDRISSNGRTLLRLVDDLLELTSVESGPVEVSVAPVELQVLIPEVLADFQDRARSASVTIHSRVDEQMSALHTDPIRLRSLIFKLVDNALKFTPAGEVEVRVLNVGDGRTPRRIEVSDTGIGMAPELLEGIFAPFEQGSEFTVRRFGGTGLGLHLARRYCELMGFTLSVTSTPGTGSTFAIDLHPAT